MAKLILKLKDNVLSEVLLNRDAPTSIGRDASNDIQLDNPAVSRFHAKIYKQGWPFYLEDLKSTNGTLLNGQGVSWKASLSHNDRISIGKYTLIFQDQNSDYQEREPHPGADSTIRITRQDG